MNVLADCLNKCFVMRGNKGKQLACVCYLCYSQDVADKNMGGASSSFP